MGKIQADNSSFINYWILSQYIFFNVFQSKILKAPPSAMLKDKRFFLTAAPLDNKGLHPAQPHYINYDTCGKYVQT